MEPYPFSAFLLQGEKVSSGHVCYFCPDCTLNNILQHSIHTFAFCLLYKAFSGSHGKALPGNSITHSVACHSWAILWVPSLPLFPCYWYAHIQITMTVPSSKAPNSISIFPMASLNDFCYLFIFYFFLSWLVTCLGLVWLARANGESCSGSHEYWTLKAVWLSLSLWLDVGWAGWTKSPDQCLYKWDPNPKGY